MRQTGIIKKTLNNNTADVMITRSSACGESCASCGLCPGKSVVINAVNSADAKAGDTVIINMSDRKVLGAAFLVYIVPLIMLILGYVLGNVLFGYEPWSVLCGFFLFALSFFIINRVDKRFKNRYTPVIEDILSSDTEGA